MCASPHEKKEKERGKEKIAAGAQISVARCSGSDRHRYDRRQGGGEGMTRRPSLTPCKKGKSIVFSRQRQCNREKKKKKKLAGFRSSETRPSTSARQREGRKEGEEQHLGASVGCITSV